MENNKRKREDGDKLAQVAELMNVWTKQENDEHDRQAKRMREYIAKSNKCIRALRQANDTLSADLTRIDDQAWSLEEGLMKANIRLIHNEEYIKRLKEANEELARTLKIALPYVPNGIIPRGRPVLIRARVFTEVNEPDYETQEELDGEETETDEEIVLLEDDEM